MSIRVLIVDDSAMVRKSLARIIEPEPDIQVVGMAPDPYVARDKILQLKPDVVLLDIEMPRMDGITFVRKIMKHHPLPVIIISSIAPKAGQVAMAALEAGAVDVLCKPDSAYSLGNLGPDVVRGIRSAAGSQIARMTAAPAAPLPRTAAPAPSTPTESTASQLASASVFSSGSAASARRRIIAIGASTGGTEATREVLQSFPGDAPGTLIVQHISDAFVGAYANRLDQCCAMRVRIANDGDLVERGVALVAPGDLHMSLVKEQDTYRVRTRNGPKVYHQRPAVDVLFKSIAKFAARDSVGILLTGMGRDGAEGLAAMRQGGARTLVQDQATCTVYGMPRAAAELGAAEEEVPLHRIAMATMRACA